MTTGTDFLRDSFKRLSFSEIFPGYFDIIKRYWWLIVSIGLLFGWLLSFPLQGPLFFTLLEKTGLNTEFCGSLFMIGHIAGLLLGGIAGLLMGRYLDWLAGGAIICQVVTLLIPFSVQETWATLFLSMGFFAGLAVISWVTRFSLEVPPEHRSRTFILGAILANIIVYLTSITLDLGINPNFLSVLLSLLPLAMPFLFLRNPRTLTPSQPASPSAISGERTEGLLTRAANTGIILFFVLLIYTVAGIVYYYIASNIVQTGNLLKYLGLIPYLIFLPAAGVMGDYFARRGNAICGALFIGIGFLLVSLFKGSAQFILFQIFLIGGYAFLDTFTWVIGADFFSKRNQSIGYGLILGVNMTAILLGNLAGYRLTKVLPESLVFLATIAGLISFVSIAIAFLLKENFRLPSSETTSPDHYSHDIANSYFRHYFNLSPREAEIAVLLYQGIELDEIREKLFISQDTLKTHLRNIYRKVGVKNRLEFTYRMMKRSEGNGDSKIESPKSFN